MKTKKCRTCGTEKPLSKKYFRRNKNYQGNYKCDCIECESILNKIKYRRRKGSEEEWRYRFKKAFGDYPMNDRELEQFKKGTLYTEEITIYN